MKRFAGNLWAFFLTLSLLTAAPVNAVDLSEGEWEVSTETKMEGTPFVMAPITQTMRYCATKEDMIPKTEEQNNCEVREQKISGNTVRWSVICREKDTAADGKGEVTYGVNTYQGTMNTTVKEKNGKTFTAVMKMSGRYLGPCTEGTKAASSPRPPDMKAPAPAMDHDMMKMMEEAQRASEKARKERQVEAPRPEAAEVPPPESPQEKAKKAVKSLKGLLGF